MRFQDPESFNRHARFQGIRNAVMKEADSFNIKVLDYSLYESRSDNTFQYYDCDLRVDVSNCPSDEYEAFVNCVKADISNDLYDMDINYALGNVNITKVGNFKKKGFFSKLFG